MNHDPLALLAEVDLLRSRVARYRAGVLQAGATKQALRDAPGSEKARTKAEAAERSMARDKAAFLKSVYDHLGTADLIEAIGVACVQAGITGDE